MNIENLNLTEEDFKMIIDGLDNLPCKNLPSEMMSELLGIITGGSNKEDEIRRARERNVRFRKIEQDNAILIENIRILQGKLLMLKKALREQGALKEANDIINPTV